MIIEAIIRAFSAALRALLSLLPEFDPPDVSSMVAEMSAIWQWGGYVDNFVPLSEAVSLLGIMLTAFAAITIVRAVLWVATKAHVLGGSS